MVNIWNFPSVASSKLLQKYCERVKLLLSVLWAKLQLSQVFFISVQIMCAIYILRSSVDCLKLILKSELDIYERSQYFK